MTNQYMTKLYHDLLSNSPQTVTIDIPADMGTGQISQIVTKQGAVVSDWRMNYFSDMNVQGVSSEEYIQMLFCFNDGVSWNIADNRQSASVQKGESCIYRGHGKMEYLCYSKKSDFLFKNVKIPLSYFYKILNDYFEAGEIEVYQKKLLDGISKVNITPYMEHIFAELKDFTQYRGGLGYLFLESKVFELLSVYLSEVLELSILASTFVNFEVLILTCRANSSQFGARASWLSIIRFASMMESRSLLEIDEGLFLPVRNIGSCVCHRPAVRKGGKPAVRK